MASWHRTDPKPAKRVRASQSEWSDIHELFEHHSCVHCGLPHQSLHHVLPRSQGGDDVLENLVPLCGDGTRGCHGLLEGHGPGWERVAASVRVYVLTNRDRCGYAVRKMGWERFNKRYPLLNEPGQRGSESRRPLTDDSHSSPGSLSDWPERKSPWDIAYEPTHFSEDR